jgi:hypothetical protein
LSQLVVSPDLCIGTILLVLKDSGKIPDDRLRLKCAPGECSFREQRV